MSTERAQDDVVGWWWSEKAQYCAAHRPSPPDDVQCWPLTASDVTDETCERCGERLLEDRPLPNATGPDSDADNDPSLSDENWPPTLASIQGREHPHGTP